MKTLFYFAISNWNIVIAVFTLLPTTPKNRNFIMQCLFLPSLHNDLFEKPTTVGKYIWLLMFIGCFLEIGSFLKLKFNEWLGFSTEYQALLKSDFSFHYKQCQRFITIRSSLRASNCVQYVRTKNCIIYWILFSCSNTQPILTMSLVG